MKHENEPEGLPVCNFCNKEYDPHDTHTCQGNQILARKPPQGVRFVSDPSWVTNEFGNPVPAASALADRLDAETIESLQTRISSRDLEMPLDKFADTVRVDGYESLEAVLFDAYLQAATGKGAVRHGRGAAFDAQPTQTISALLGTDSGLAFQAMKKINEGMRLDPAAKKRELLGAINYIASIIIFMNKETK